MNFDERLDLYLEGGMIDKEDVEDINNVVKLFKDEYKVELEEENAGTFIAHLCAAFNRNKTHEDVEELPDVVVDELKALDTYEESLTILDKIMDVIHNELNDTEKAYCLLHLNNLIATFKQEDKWQASI